jgi:vesicle-associated membrane protein 7
MSYSIGNYNSNNNITKVKNQLGGIKNVMVDNIDKVLGRGESIDTLVTKTDELKGVGMDYKIKSRKLKNKMLWKYLTLACCLMSIIMIIIFVVVWLACGFPDFGRCVAVFKPSDKKD